MRTYFSSLTILLLAVAGPCWALPTPKTDQELLNMSDLVVDASCVKVVCDGPATVDSSKTVSSYLSTLWPSKSYKGGMPNSVTVRGVWYTWTSPSPTGWWNSAIKEGWKGKIYLKKDTGNAYTMVWWNATKTDPTATLKGLPSCIASDGGVPDAQPADATTQDSVQADSGKADTSPTADSSPTADAIPAADASPTADGAAPPPTDDDGGCSCEAGRGPAPFAGLALLMLGLLLTLRRGRAR